MPAVFHSKSLFWIQKEVIIYTHLLYTSRTKLFGEELRRVANQKKAPFLRVSCAVPGACSRDIHVHRVGSHAWCQSTLTNFDEYSVLKLTTMLWFKADQIISEYAALHPMKLEKDENGSWVPVWAMGIALACRWMRGTSNNIALDRFAEGPFLLPTDGTSLYSRC